MMIRYIAVYLIVVNLITFIIYGADKHRARQGRRRIQEMTLLVLAVVGGSLGALLGIYGFRHKTKHKKFTILVPLILICQLTILIYCFWQPYI